MRHIVRVKGSCSDRPCGVEAIDGKNNGALAGACTYEDRWVYFDVCCARPIELSAVGESADGTSVVSKIWNGRASLFELDVSGPVEEFATTILEFTNHRGASARTR